MNTANSTKSTLFIKVALFINYFVFAILLNSVGAVILQLQRNLNISEGEVSILEAFKDLPIAIASFLVASLLPRLGMRRGMMLGMAAVAVMCLIMPFIGDEFWHYKLMFAVIGVSFAIIKIGVYATIGLVTDNTKEHSSLMSWIEGTFMIGVLFGNVLISWFVDDIDPTSRTWLNVYWVLGVLCVLAVVFMFFSPLDEKESQKTGNNSMDDFLEMFKLLARPLVLVFVISAFLFVLIEQSFQTWTPTFYKDVLNLPTSMGIQAGAILAGAFALGRIGAGFILKKIKWFPFLMICLGVLAVAIFVNVSMAGSAKISADTNWFNAPFIVYIFPLMGLFLSPIYPTINSVILSGIQKHLQSSMAGLIVVFSALGGTLGSIITGNLFEKFDGSTAFLCTLIPLALLATALFLLSRLNNRKTANQ